MEIKKAAPLTVTFKNVLMKNYKKMYSSNNETISIAEKN